PKVIVGMTAYNDEGVIGKAVQDFKSNPLVSKVIVVDNNSIDKTFEEAKKAGAQTVKESVQGYGACCMRALKEARKGADIVVLVEGDQTFSSTDLKKLLAYIENADMVVGTRTTTELCAPDSQMNWFMQYGNIFIAKLIQLRYWGKLRLTDVGCTFRAIRPEALDKIMLLLSVKGNYFSPHMILQALKSDLKVIEVPVTLKKRAGKSKGVGSSISKGLATGLQMWKEILLS
ncbi:MAG: glycosyltransferase family 2 protein, partial [Candidatus Diapherotrites archaeon]